MKLILSRSTNSATYIRQFVVVETAKKLWIKSQELLSYDFALQDMFIPVHWFIYSYEPEIFWGNNKGCTRNPEFDDLDMRKTQKSSATTRKKVHRCVSEERPRLQQQSEVGQDWRRKITRSQHERCPCCNVCAQWIEWFLSPSAAGPKPVNPSRALQSLQLEGVRQVPFF